ncbi:MAG TPA: thiol reductant ABC exporter subunit CydC [Geobacteraceae bacterium]|nr:thiol reductant ABC exporter subunit CydC [Geobacteraceae bacterium]
MGELIRILAVARGQWRWMAGGILLGIFVILANALLMAVSGWFIAAMAVAGVTKVSFNYFTPSAAIRGLAISRTVGRYIERLVTHGAALRVLAELRVWLFRRLEPLSPGLLERYSSGDITGRLRGDVDAMENLYVRIIAPLCAGAVSIVISTLFVAWWCRSAAVALLVFLAVAGLLLPLLARRLAERPGRRSVELSGELRTLVTDGLQGGAELMLLGAVEQHAARVDKVSLSLVATQEELAGGVALNLAGGVAAAGFGVAAVLLCGAAEVVNLTINGPQLVMLLLFSAAAFEAAGGMPAALQLLPAARESARRIGELSSSPLPVPDPANPAPLPVDYRLVMRGVSFAYEPTRPVLSNFDLEIPAGGRVAVVGPSGFGKSSIAELLLRFREYGGSITFGGTELRCYAGDDLRRLVAVSPQRPHLFNTTIRENLLLSRPEATAEELQDALEASALDTWVASLPDGLETMVGEGGSSVSGGEVRRIALARALLKDAPLLILDEPTEGLDAATEQLVLERLQKRIQGKSLFLITHRPACLSLVDTVVKLG